MVTKQQLTATDLTARVADLLGPYFVEQPHPLMRALTIQVVLLRNVLDFTALRTEETRELNTATTPLSITDSHAETRVVMHASKQKAVESRWLEQLLRAGREAADLPAYDCYLKDHLCLACPRCVLFGGSNTSSSASKDDQSKKLANIRHRIEYGSAFSLMPFRDIADTITFNGITDTTQQTGQTLNWRPVVVPATIFPSVVTLRSVTATEFVLTLKTILSAHRYGAETRIGGEVRNNVVGIVAGWEEIMTPLELTLELYDQKDTLGLDAVHAVLERYAKTAGNPTRVRVLTTAQTEMVVDAACGLDLDRPFLENAWKNAEAYRDEQSASATSRGR